MKGAVLEVRRRFQSSADQGIGRVENLGSENCYLGELGSHTGRRLARHYTHTLATFTRKVLDFKVVIEVHYYVHSFAKLDYS